MIWYLWIWLFLLVIFVCITLYFYNAKSYKTVNKIIFINASPFINVNDVIACYIKLKNFTINDYVYLNVNQFVENVISDFESGEKMEKKINWEFFNLSIVRAKSLNVKEIIVYSTNFARINTKPSIKVHLDIDLGLDVNLYQDLIYNYELDTVIESNIHEKIILLKECTDKKSLTDIEIILLKLYLACNFTHYIPVYCNNGVIKNKQDFDQRFTSNQIALNLIECLH